MPTGFPMSTPMKCAYTNQSETKETSEMWTAMCCEAVSNAGGMSTQECVALCCGMVCVACIFIFGIFRR
jgi:hypothetical protein